MGVDTQRASRRPPLPAPTDTSTSGWETGAGGPETDLETDVSRRTDRTDKTSYSIPEDGSPVTISTKKRRDGDSRSSHPSQTSLLIEYFEGGKSQDGKEVRRPSVRVRVTPSSRKSKRDGNSGDHVQITRTDRNREPSYTRRISLSNRNERGIETSEISNSDVSNLSGAPPVEIEVLNRSDISRSDDASRGLTFIPGSDISSMPPDSMLEGSNEPTLGIPRKAVPAKEPERVEEPATVAVNMLKAPTRSRSLSRERLTQKAVEKIMSQQRGEREGSSSKLKGIEQDKGAMLGSELSHKSDRSGMSGISATSSINNPKLLATVEDAIRRLILPEITTLREEQARYKKAYLRDSIASGGTTSSYGSDDRRRVSKVSSEPRIRSGSYDRNAVFDDRDEPEGSRRRHRRSSKDSTSTVRDEERSRSHRKSSREKSGSRARDVAAGALAGGAAAALTAAALKKHDSSGSLDRRERRKSRGSVKSGSRSRRDSVSEHFEDGPDDIPPMPMQSELVSDLTRDSILSAPSDVTDVPAWGSTTPRGKHRSKSSLKERDLMEVSRGSPRHVISPTARTPTRTPVRTPASVKQGLGTHHDNLSPVSTVRSARSARDVPSPGRSPKTSAGAGLALAPAAMAAAAAIVRAKGGDFHDDVSELTYEEGLAPHTPTRSAVSPMQSVGSHRSEHGRAMVGDLGSPGAVECSDTVKRHRPHAISLERGHEIMGAATPSPSRARNATTPGGYSDPGNIEREAEEFFRRAHEENDRYRSELDVDPAALGTESLDDYDPKRLTRITENTEDDWAGDQQNLRQVGQNHTEYVRTPHVVESAVASLHDPSLLSVQSSRASQLGATPDADARHSQADSVTLDRGVGHVAGSPHRLQPENSGERWSAIREQAQALSDQHSPAQGLLTPGRKQSGETPLLQTESPVQRASAGNAPRELQKQPSVAMSARGLPGLDEPAIGFIPDDESDIVTNPTEIQGAKRLSGSDKLGFDKRAALAAAAAGAVMGVGAVGLARGKHSGEHLDEEIDAHGYMQPKVEDNYDDYHGYDPVQGAADATQKGPELSRTLPVANNDEGYQTDTHTKGQAFANVEGELDDDYPDVQARSKYLSGMSAGMESPLYDASTGRGMDRIKSKDVVALMDHLTVRDAQRNARDTEILVTLVRSAAEMRTQWEEMKRFIREQDRLVMSNADRNADITVQKILGGPRPQPLGSPRGPPRPASEATDDMAKKRQNVFRRALKGLSMKGNSDLTKIEDMLMQLLTEVEELKTGQGLPRGATLASGTRPPSMGSFEQLRGAPDAGYEPEGRAGTSSSPNQSGFLSNPSSRHLMHPGYDGRRGSEGQTRVHRVSTVPEDDEDGYDMRAPLANHPFSSAKMAATADQRLLTPTQEAYQNKGKARDLHDDDMDMHLTPPRQIGGQFQQGSSNENTPARGSEKKHKSGSSSIFGIPRISRWSKTTSSTVAPDSAGPQGSSRQRPFSEASRSGSHLDLTQYDDGAYHVEDEDRLRSTNSLAMEERARGSPAVHASATYMPTVDDGMPHAIPRSPSPLIPETASTRSKASAVSQEDPKYQVHRNSLNLQHPQPRQGQTGRHQNHLEGVANSFDPKDFGLGSDLSGISNSTSGVAQPHDQWGSEPALALNRQRFSGGSSRDDGPLVPPPASQQAPQGRYAGRTQEQGPSQALDATNEEEERHSGKEAHPQYVGPTLTNMPPAPPNTLAGYQAAPPLAPIQEVPSVRYSLDEGSLRDMRDDMTPSPSLRNQPRMQTPTRKITGPRPMPGSGSRNVSGVREMMSKKSFDSLESYRDSVDGSETF